MAGRLPPEDDERLLRRADVGDEPPHQQRLELAVAHLLQREHLHVRLPEHLLVLVAQGVDDLEARVGGVEPLPLAGEAGPRGDADARRPLHREHRGDVRALRERGGDGAVRRRRRVLRPQHDLPLRVHGAVEADAGDTAVVLHPRALVDAGGEVAGSSTAAGGLPVDLAD
eukprot:gene5674-biopygen198